MKTEQERTYLLNMLRVGILRNDNTEKYALAKDRMQVSTKPPLLSVIVCNDLRKYRLNHLMQPARFGEQ